MFSGTCPAEAPNQLVPAAKIGDRSYYALGGGDQRATFLELKAEWPCPPGTDLATWDTHQQLVEIMYLAELSEQFKIKLLVF